MAELQYLQAERATLNGLREQNNQLRASTEFMEFWRVLNEVLAARRQPQMLFFEARMCWQSFNESRRAA